MTRASKMQGLGAGAVVATGRAGLMEAAPDAFFASAVACDVVQPARLRGTHGHRPVHPWLRTATAGPRVAAGARLATAGARLGLTFLEAAPPLAAILA